MVILKPIWLFLRKKNEGKIKCTVSFLLKQPTYRKNQGYEKWKMDITLAPPSMQQFENPAILIS